MQTAPTATQNADPLLTTEEAASYIGCRPQTLNAARCTRTGSFATLPWLKLGQRKVAYRKSALDTWLNACSVTAVEA